MNAAHECGYTLVMCSPRPALDFERHAGSLWSTRAARLMVRAFTAMAAIDIGLLIIAFRS